MRRTELVSGFTFLTPPWWFGILEPFNTRERFGKLAWYAYIASRDPERITNLHAIRWQLTYYPLWWIVRGMKTIAKRSLALLIILAILGIPFGVGYLVGATHHILIEVR